MPRLSVTLTKSLHSNISLLAQEHHASMATMMNHLLLLGLEKMEKSKDYWKFSEVEQHCHQLIIQMNALIKNMAAEILKFNQSDFDKLRQAALDKYRDLSKS